MRSDLVRQIRSALQKKSSPARVLVSARYFRTGPGEYGEGDVFIGVSNPDIQSVVRAFAVQTPFLGIDTLMQSQIHEERFAAVCLLNYWYAKRKDMEDREKIFRYVLKNLKHINNWDLVDTIAPKLIGPYILATKEFTRLTRWAKSKKLWERRIAIISTQHFIREGKFSETLRLARLLLRDEEDLIHKAVGWMLREVGKRDQTIVNAFLEVHAAVMPRTMLRYALEKLSPAKRKYFMSLKANLLSEKRNFVG